MEYFNSKNFIIIIFIVLLLSALSGCSKPNFDAWDKLWDRIDNMSDEDKVSESDQKLIQEATEKEWEEVDKQTDK